MPRMRSATLDAEKLVEMDGRVPKLVPEAGFCGIAVLGRELRIARYKLGRLRRFELVCLVLGDPRSILLPADRSSMTGQ